MIVAWLFVLATLIAVFGITAVFKKMMRKYQQALGTNGEIPGDLLNKERVNLFVKFAMIEALPIILVIIGFTQIFTIEPVTFADVMLPFILVIVIYLIGLLNVYMSRKETLSMPNITGWSKQTVTTDAFLSVGLIGAIPTISVVALIVMISQ